MLRNIVLAIAIIFSAAANAQNCPANPYSLANGTNADATQVMSNFNNLLNCLNSNVMPLSSGVMTGSPSAATTFLVHGNGTANSYGIKADNAYYAIQGTSGLAGGIGVFGSHSLINGYGVYGYNTTGYGIFCNAPVCGGVTAWYTSSDQRLKTSIRALSEADGLAAIMKLRPVRYRWKDQDFDKNKGEQVGFIAQEIESVFPEFVSTTPTNTEINVGGRKEVVEAVKAVSNAELTAPLVKAIQQLKAELDNTRAEFQAYKASRP